MTQSEGQRDGPPCGVAMLVEATRRQDREEASQGVDGQDMADALDRECCAPRRPGMRCFRTATPYPTIVLSLTPSHWI